jgi:deferrochelatase/peroxidase EfeB
MIADVSADLPDAEDKTGVKDIGRNGTYLVIRQLEQDVKGFWRYLSKQTNNDRSQAESLAEVLVGRKMSGDPLLPLSREEINGVGPDPVDQSKNRFTFESDPDGVVCPRGAHIRRANPRNTDFPPNTPRGWISRLSRILALDRLGKDGNKPRDLIGSTRFHRLLRRGREYGPEVAPAERFDAPSPDEGATGLNFICLNANIGRQFEFVQSAWIMDSKFDGLTGESDPLLGNREPVSGCPVSNFSLPAANGIRRQLEDVPPFVTVRGGAYFFLPGRRALRYLANFAKVSSS